MEWRKRVMAVSPVEKTKKLDPRIERLLQLILEARRARAQAVKTEVGYTARPVV
jgi:hypothetical protein